MFRVTSDNRYWLAAIIQETTTNAPKKPKNNISKKIVLLTSKRINRQKTLQRDKRKYSDCKILKGPGNTRNVTRSPYLPQVTQA